jgi:hypothetical protein
MASKTHVHTERLSDTYIRELSVAYDKGGINYWDYSQQPKGIYFRSSLYEQPEGSIWKTWTTGQKGDGYILVVPLDRYRPKALREVTERVLANADRIHALLDAADAHALTELKTILTGATASGAAA